MTEDEQREALLAFAKSFGDAAGAMALAFVGIATAMRECGDAVERLVEAAGEEDV